MLSIQTLSEPYAPSICKKMQRSAGPETSPQISGLDLLEEIHGPDMNCPCDVATCPVFTAQVDHNHILLIPQLGHTKEIQRMHNLVATKHEKTITSDEQTNMRESLGTQV